MLFTKKKAAQRDSRLAATDQVKFTRSASDVLEMFSEKSMASNPLIAKSTSLGGVHGLAGPTAVTSDKFDPLKAEAEKACEAGYSRPAETKKKPKTYKEHVDRVTQLYDSYLNVDSSGLPGRKKKPPR